MAIARPRGDGASIVLKIKDTPDGKTGWTYEDRINNKKVRCSWQEDSGINQVRLDGLPSPWPTGGRQRNSVNSPSASGM